MRNNRAAEKRNEISMADTNVNGGTQQATILIGAGPKEEEEAVADMEKVMVGPCPVFIV